MTTFGVYLLYVLLDLALLEFEVEAVSVCLFCNGTIFIATYIHVFVAMLCIGANDIHHGVVL